MTFQPGNKLGRGRPPAGKSLSDALRVALAERLPDGRTVNRAIADALVTKAMAGDIQAIKEIADRVEGRPAVNMAEENGSRPIVIEMAELDLRTC